MKKIVSILYCLLVLHLAFGQKAPKGTNINLSNTDDFEGLEKLDSLIQNAQVIMTGENHTFVSFNAKMEMKMLRYLNKKTGLRNFVIELGEARAQFLNRYINNSDTMAEKYLKATTSPRYMDLFKRLKKFNLELPDSLKIIVWGIDVERFNDLPILRLNELLPKGAIPASIRAGVETIRGTAAYLLTTGLEDYENARDEKNRRSGYGGYYSQPFYTGPTTRRIIRYFDSLRPEFKHWLGKDFDAVEKAISWLKQYKQWKDYDGTTFQYIWREENIYKNLSALLVAKSNEKFYGQFGRCHVAYEEQNGDCGWYGYHSVINKLKSRYFLHPEKLLTIGLFYNGFSEYNYTEREERVILRNEIEELVSSTKNKSVTMFDLRDSDADLPQLFKKFTFVVVNNHAVIEDDDSVESEVIADSKSKKLTSFNYLGYGYGLGWSNASTNNLNIYLSKNGKKSKLGNNNWHSFFIDLSSKRLDLSSGFNWRLYDTAYADDTGFLMYKSNLTHLRLGFNAVNKKRIKLSIGGVGAFGRETLKYTLKHTDIFTANSEKILFNDQILVGMYVNFTVRFLDMFFISTDISEILNLSQNQYRLKGNYQAFGSKNELTKGLSGTYYFIRIGFGGFMF